MEISSCVPKAAIRAVARVYVQHKKPEEPDRTFGQAYRLYLSHHGPISKRTKDFYQSYLRNHFGDWTERQMADITEQEILARVETVQQNTPGAAEKILRLISAMFRLHLIGTSKRNPVVAAIEMLRNDGKMKDQSNLKQLLQTETNQVASHSINGLGLPVSATLVGVSAVK